MNKEEKKSGVSIFGQSEYLAGTDPIEEMFALNLGDFLSENLISEDLAKKISVKSNKKERLINQLKELIDLYSSKNTLCVLDFNKNEEISILLLQNLLYVCWKSMNAEYFSQKKIN